MPRQYVVIGCHGSGVGVVAEVMRLLGVKSGNLPFAIINGRLLRDAGGDWLNPPATEAILAITAHDADMERAVSKRDAAHSAWGWADPQTCLTLGKWAPLLSAPTFVWVGRSVRDTEAEMHARHKIDAEASRQLMRRYLADAGLYLAGPHNGRLVCMSYDQLRADPVGQVESLAWWLRAQPTTAQMADAVAYIGGLSCRTAG